MYSKQDISIEFYTEYQSDSKRKAEILPSNHPYKITEQFDETKKQIILTTEN